MDDVTWGALTLSLTVLGGIATWFAFQRRGVASGLRMLAFTLLPLAAYLTRTLQMFTRIADAIRYWLTSLVFHPTVWVGVVLAGLSVLLFVVSGAMRARQLGSSTASASTKRSDAPRPVARKSTPASDSELDDIETLLRKHGIS